MNPGPQIFRRKAVRWSLIEVLEMGLWMAEIVKDGPLARTETRPHVVAVHALHAAGWVSILAKRVSRYGGAGSVKNLAGWAASGFAGAVPKCDFKASVLELSWFGVALQGYFSDRRRVDVWEPAIASALAEVGRKLVRKRGQHGQHFSREDLRAGLDATKQMRRLLRSGAARRGAASSREIFAEALEISPRHLARLLGKG